MKGRDTASPEARLTAEYLAAHLYAAGAQPMGEHRPGGRTFFQRFPLEVVTPLSEGSALTLTLDLNGAKRIVECKLGDDYVLRPSGVLSGEIDSEVVERHLAMLADLTQPEPAKPRRRLRRSVALVAAGVLVTAGAGVGTAAAFGVFSQAPADRGIAHCYATVDLDDPSNHTDFMLAVDPKEVHPGGVGDAAAIAMEVCEGGWAQGRFSATDPKVSDPDPTRADFPVPALVACVLPDGSVGVFPGDPRTCAILELPQALI